MNATIFPILKTERLTLRQLSIEDRQAVLILRSDPEINKYLDRKPAKTTEDAINFINKVNENFEKNISIYWAITLTKSKTFVGTICIFDCSSEESRCEIGYELMTNFQGQGIMPEAAEAVIKYAFQVLKFNNIHASTHCNNQNSTRLLTKLNFEKNAKTNNENPELNTFTLTQQNDRKSNDTN